MNKLGFRNHSAFKFYHSVKMIGNRVGFEIIFDQN